ncbi:hypothetical protein [Anaeromicrobium sediminis]|uniref:Uncharacterized protein n=1 Tax=Anaeromicrobium sediminis TaxID=1478221 RepID=A0A267ML51_9FIRM|nr:hypothetical protein [Anaeromicrobium sediminis]PAB60334.1 hypothetical protein CCE28_05415 [Anaeromicrobium sediminis]
MEKTIWDIEVKMMIPFDLLAKYPDDDIDEYIIHPKFVEIMKLLNVEFDVRRIIETLYRQRSGKSAFQVHYSTETFEEFIILDTYIDATDQLDLIYIMFRSKDVKGGSLRKLTHSFYTETCPYNVYYEEGSYVIKTSTTLDFTKPSKLQTDEVRRALKDKKVILYRADEIIQEFELLKINNEVVKKKSFFSFKNRKQ